MKMLPLNIRTRIPREGDGWIMKPNLMLSRSYNTWLVPVNNKNKDDDNGDNLIHSLAVAYTLNHISMRIVNDDLSEGPNASSLLLLNKGRGSGSLWLPMNTARVESEKFARQNMISNLEQAFADRYDVTIEVFSISAKTLSLESTTKENRPSSPPRRFTIRLLFHGDQYWVLKSDDWDNLDLVSIVEAVRTGKKQDRLPVAATSLSVAPARAPVVAKAVTATSCQRTTLTVTRSTINSSSVSVAAANDDGTCVICGRG
jgi:hypothetical protein